MNTRLLASAIFCASLLSHVVFAAEPKVAKQFNLKFDLDTVLALPALWELTPEKLEEACKADGFKENPYFKWLTQSNDGVRFSRKPYNNVSVDLTIFGGQLAVEELVIEFKDGKASGANVSLFN